MESRKQAPNGSRHLPEHLWHEILSRLSAKSLLRFRSVSKSWLSLINDPAFRRLHLRNLKSNRDETRLLVVEGDFEADCRHYALRLTDTFQSNPETTLHTLGVILNNDSWSINCFIDGLFLLENTYRKQDSKQGRAFVLWNPSIRRFRDVPPVPGIESSDSGIGLGYDPLAKDYKYVRLVRGGEPDVPPLVAIYAVGIGSWRVVPFQGDWDYGSLYSFRNACSVRGSLYFLAVNTRRDLVELISFDLSKERFRRFSRMPIEIAYSCRNDSPGFGKVVRLEPYGSSSLLVFDFENDRYLWAWETESMCWSKPYPRYDEMGGSELLYLKKNRDVLIHKEEDDSVSSYNLETGEEKVLMFLKEDGDADDIYDVYGYIESLILL